MGAKSKLNVSEHREEPAGVLARRFEGRFLFGGTFCSRTPLHLSAAIPDIALARLLIANGAEIDPPDREGATPLYLAIEGNQKDLAQLLIEKGADGNIIDTYGHTPLKIANISKRAEIAALLCTHGAKE